MIIFVSACSYFDSDKYNNNPCKANSEFILKKWRPQGSSSYPKNFCIKCDDYDSTKVNCHVYNLSLSFQYPELEIHSDSLASIIAKTFWEQPENKMVDTLNLTLESTFSLSEKYPSRIFATDNLIKENLRQDAIAEIRTSYQFQKNIYDSVNLKINNASNSKIKSQSFGEKHFGYFVANVMTVDVDIDVLSMKIFPESFVLKNNFKQELIANNVDDFELEYSVLRPNSAYCTKQTIEICFFLNDKQKKASKEHFKD